MGNALISAKSHVYIHVYILTAVQENFPKQILERCK